MDGKTKAEVDKVNRLFPNASAAKDFLVEKVVAQAQRDDVPLSEAERKMMYFSVIEPTIANEVCGQFPDYDPEYEQKITDLLRSAYQSDKEDRGSFKDALHELKKGDHYLAIMAKSAFKPAPGSFKDQFNLLLWGLVATIVLVLVVLGWDHAKEAFWHWYSNKPH